MRNPLLSHSIRCVCCGATRRGHGLTRIRATARRDGWTRSGGHDYCHACTTQRPKTGAAADRDGGGKTLAAAAPTTTEEN